MHAGEVETSNACDADAHGAADERLISTSRSSVQIGLLVALTAATLFLAAMACWARLRGLTGGDWGLLVLFVFLLTLTVSQLVTYDRKKRRRIIVDPIERTVTFEHFHIENSFWPKRAVPKVTMSFDDIRRVYHMPPMGGGLAELTIHTTQGRVTVHSDMSCFDDLRASLEDLVQSRGVRYFRWDKMIVCLMGVTVLIAVVVAIMSLMNRL